MRLKVLTAALAVGITTSAAYSGVQIVDSLKPNTVIKQEEQSFSFKNKANFTVKEEIEVLSEKILIKDVPHIQQMPELARGCEVTSLAMMLQFAGVSVDKMTLAQDITTIPFRDQNGLYGNPNEGFVGNIYTFENPGYGVYHGPIVDLAENYLPGRILDLTGKSIVSVYNMVKNGSPVWVIVNSRFAFLSEDEFKDWETASGTEKITYREHSVVIVGYDDDYVHLNDPLADEGYTSVPRDNFEAAWKQMGKQAVSYLSESINLKS